MNDYEETCPVCGSTKIIFDIDDETEEDIWYCEDCKNSGRDMS